MYILVHKRRKSIKIIVIFNILNYEFISKDQCTVLSIQKSLNKTQPLNQYVYVKCIF